jgi:type IV secretory pathway ATPase VirB11/archaellum biosynthesis ATPase
MIDREIEKRNINAIQKLNQRGGRMLSVVDLFEDGTLDRKLIKFFIRRIWSGDSILAAAGPSGTGKTTLMGSLLNLIPPGVRIQTAERGDPIGTKGSSYLHMAHELNDAPYYGYIWGVEARQFLKLARDGQLMATLHAESLEGVRNKLSGQPVGLGKKEFEEIDLVITMKKSRQGRETVRRVEEVYGFSGGAHRKLFKWNSTDDSYEEVKSSTYRENREEKFNQLDTAGFLDRLLAERPKRLNEVRELLLEFAS